MSVASAPNPSYMERGDPMRPIETIDVSLPRTSSATKTAGIAGDLAVAVLLVLLLPVGLVIVFSPLTGLVRAILSLAGML
jgi:hypothetical protein